jgi:hypothetical protein
MEIKSPYDLKRDVDTALFNVQMVIEAAQKKFASGEYCFTWPTVLGLLNKLDEFNPEKTFTLFWHDGTTQLVTGNTLHLALFKAGVVRQASSDHFGWAEGDVRSSYEWDEVSRNWEPTV